MASTGVVRRIDELGRIVIPKELRKTLRIKEGENLEIFVDDQENIILKKHSFINNINNIAACLVDSVYNIFKHEMIITDTSHIIAVSGKLKKKILNKQISKDLEELLINRKSKLEHDNDGFSLTDNCNIENMYAITPIISNGDAIGLIIMTNEILDEIDYKLCEMCSIFLGKYVES